MNINDPNSATNWNTIDITRLYDARAKTWEAVFAIASHIKVGMKEQDAVKLATTILRDMGARKFWHPVHIRFGTNTVKGYREDSEPDVILKESDIYFIDIGPIFNGYEGDCGQTFSVGDNPNFKTLAEKSKIIFQQVKHDWLQYQLTGEALWQRAANYAKEQNVEMLPPYVKGHRIAEFPHSAISKDKLFDLKNHPQPEKWILEIQVQDNALAVCSFYEDLL